MSGQRILLKGRKICHRIRGPTIGNGIRNRVECGVGVRNTDPLNRDGYLQIGSHLDGDSPLTCVDYLGGQLLLNQGALSCECLVGIAVLSISGEIPAHVSRVVEGVRAVWHDVDVVGYNEICTGYNYRSSSNRIKNDLRRDNYVRLCLD